MCSMSGRFQQIEKERSKHRYKLMESDFLFLKQLCYERITDVTNLPFFEMNKRQR